MIRIACLLFGYIFGLFQTSIILGKIKGVDVRKHGSGNAGTTNTLRVLGFKAGMIVLAGDILKCMIPILLVKIFLKDGYGEMLWLLVFWTAAGVILGHNYPFYLKFKGGKGIATTAGLILSMPWPFIAIEVLVFFGIFFTTHYVSLGSLCVYLVLLICTVLFGQIGWFDKLALPVPQSVLWEMYILMAVLAAMAYWKHRANIGRLLRGEERKTYLFKKNEQ
ncbi:MAG: glycerol-3-phosphate 1-O-acyltransferase PlsY [Lachnospiraceae bacterium]|jgi:glycerol-3-phosphate acyltransferase PlsY|nr:glycerol-3-phosphate 1-O-acyltransferase PlsY [Lachnospiraceae bacterium]